MRAVWLVRWQDLARRIRYWTAIIGYDPLDHSLVSRIYLLYMVIFFSIWGLAVLALLAGFGSSILSLVSGLPPSITSIWILSAVLFIVTCYLGYQYGFRSPFVFSDADAELICQTPVDRRQVALAWFLGDWFPGSLLFAALAVVLCSASFQMDLAGRFEWANLPAFLLSAVKVACIALLLHMGFISLVYTLGGIRLTGNRDLRWLRWVPLGVSILLLMVFSSAVVVAQVALWPVLFPLQAALGIASWFHGMLVVLLLAAAGLLLLFGSSSGLNLSRAAQESRPRWAMHQVALLGNTQLSQAMKTRQQLGFGHPLSRLPAREGMFSLMWKDAVFATRSIRLSSAFTWVGIFAVSLGMLLTADWGTRIWAYVIWGVLVIGPCTSGLRSDLGVWSLMRQLPFSAWEIIFATCIVPTVAVILMSWVSLLISTILDNQSPALIILLPVTILCIVLSAVFDLLRQSRSSELLIGQVAEAGGVGLVIGLILGALPILLVSWLSKLLPDAGMGVLILITGAGVGLAEIYALWRLVAYAYKNMS